MVVAGCPRHRDLYGGLGGEVLPLPLASGKAGGVWRRNSGDQEQDGLGLRRSLLASDQGFRSHL